MVATVSINPMATTNAGGLFSVTTDGMVQGAIMDDPVARFALATGYVAQSETLPMWPGIAISETVPAGTSLANGTPDRAYGPALTRATTVTAGAGGITGFTTLNQMHAGIVTPQNKVPSLGSYMTVPFFRLGSGARMALACDPGLAATLLGGSTRQQLSWDFNDQLVVAYDASTPTVSLTSITSSYAAGPPSLYTFVVVAAAATNVAAVGDVINISGVTGTGAALVNGSHVVTAFTDNENFSFQIAAASGAIATGALTGTKVVNQGVGLLPIQAVIDSNFGNSQTVQWDAVNLVANWNYSGSAVLVIL